MADGAWDGCPARIAEGPDEAREDAALGPKHRGALALEQQRLALHAPAIAAEVAALPHHAVAGDDEGDRKSTRLNSSHSQISYAVFCLKKKKKKNKNRRRCDTRNIECHDTANKKGV